MTFVEWPDPPKVGEGWQGIIILNETGDPIRIEFKDGVWREVGTGKPVSLTTKRADL